MIASLMMYARPELVEAHHAYWAAIRGALARRGIDSPQVLSNDVAEFDVWRAPDLVLSQTCGLPYRAYLSDDVTLVGTPDFGLPGCPAGYYNSAIVVRKDDERSTLEAFADARFTYNQNISQSGYAAIYFLAQESGFWFSDRVESGGHVTSARMVAERQADIAAIDAQTWRNICRFDAFAAKLRVLAMTPPTPSLPYISAKGVNAAALFGAVAEAIETLDDASRQALDLHGFIPIPKEDYLAIPNPPLPR